MIMPDGTVDVTPLEYNEFKKLELTFLEGINSEDVMAILSGAIRQHLLSPFSMLYQQDEPVHAIYILVEGIINQYRSDVVAGKSVRHITRTVRQGGLLGHLEFLQGINYSTNARSEDACHLISIDIHAFSRLIYHFPTIRNKLYPQEIAARLSTFPFMGRLGMPAPLHPIVCAFLADETTRVKDIEPGQVLYRVGDLVEHIYLVHEGQVKVEQRGNPEETHLLGNGAMFGAAQSASGFIGLGSVDRAMAHEATTQTKTTLYKIPYHSFRSITGIEPDQEIYKSIARRHAVIERLTVFSSLSLEIRAQIAGFVSHMILPHVRLIIQQGEIVDSLWVLVDGRASIRSLDKNGQQISNAVAIGPTYFAEQALLGQIPQESTVEAQPGSEWLRFHWRDLEALSKQLASSHQLEGDLRSRLLIRRDSKIQERAKDAISDGGDDTVEEVSRRAASRRFDWLEPGEQVIESFRRHWIAFLQKNLLGIIIFPLALAVYVLADFLPGVQYVLRAISILLLVIDGIVLVWGTIDYLNDWLTITDTRVVHQEKVLFVNEWRKQAPLEQIQNVDSSTTWLGKILNYGTLTVATAAKEGTISFDYAANYRELQALIETQRERRKRGATAASKLTIHRKLEARLGIAVDIPSRVYHGGPSIPEKVSLGKRLLRNIQKHMRKEEKNRIIWRKHWLVLLPRLWLPLLIFLLMTLFTLLPSLTESFDLSAELTPFLNALTIVGVLLTLIALGNVIWVIADWRNDTYEVTEDEIIHVDRMPLGLSEERKSANLGRIQNVEMSIPSILHWFFNYGNVTCQTAAETGAFIFYGVPDPRAVAKEILTRMDTHRRRAERNAAVNRSQDLPDWFEMYNRIEPEVLEERAPRSG